MKRSRRALLVAASAWAALAGATESNVRVTASDGAILNAVGCNVGVVSLGTATPPVLTAMIDCRPDRIFASGME